MMAAHAAEDDGGGWLPVSNFKIFLHNFYITPCKRMHIFGSQNFVE